MARKRSRSTLLAMTFRGVRGRATGSVHVPSESREDLVSPPPGFFPYPLEAPRVSGARTRTALAGPVSRPFLKNRHFQRPARRTFLRPPVSLPLPWRAPGLPLRGAPTRLVGAHHGATGELWARAHLRGRKCEKTQKRSDFRPRFEPRTARGAPKVDSVA